MPRSIEWADALDALTTLGLGGVARLTRVTITRFTVDVTYMDADDQEINVVLATVGGPLG